MSDPETARPVAWRPDPRARGSTWLHSDPLPEMVGVVTYHGTEADGVDWRGSLALTTAHCTIVVVDVESFGRRSRTNPNRVRIRRGMYRAIERAFAAAGIPWDICRHEDLGDGVLVLVPARVSKTLFADLLLGELADELQAHNGVHPPLERIRLRLALHAGEVSYDAYGATGSSILHAQRLLDAPELRRALADTKAVLAVIASAWVFDEVIRHSERGFVDAYRCVRTEDGAAWIRLLPASATARRRELARRRRLG
ncbi:Uncharacterised protein [Amycolatopsis camponoti]|uniref:Guanylate cyclase domain-containing protein n=1 Tax=Amycolatopsis camponoti TaxID=2606593 RepID=A0A6I8LV48_9PSEU|nr:hypothetical protein [Amycolatopsis camponoti]VVJ19475.1 Uncharacterised protein [Amycolatopsis camponoti]